jgi:hypothetical protein
MNSIAEMRGWMGNGDVAGEKWGTSRLSPDYPGLSPDYPPDYPSVPGLFPDYLSPDYSWRDFSAMEGIEDHEN